jgi:hypothetical protein
VRRNDFQRIGCGERGLEAAEEKIARGHEQGSMMKDEG